ncbi:MAG: 50S ribosomal protein L11 methyltransferase [Wenzhouxiangellaceae bacterium]|nr:50S ribosomal protein L11 methyltransferase [Wenzhouxiangellaceae bacterium]
MDETSKIRFAIPGERVETCEALLWAGGALAVTLLDARDQPLLEPSPGETPVWDEAIVEALFPGPADPAGIETGIGRALVEAGVLESADRIESETVESQDWERAWMDRFEPMRFGASTWICPSHLEPDPDWDVVVRLDPGLAFGTGTHPTTALCLEWIDGRDLDGRTVVDYGCGSGVLAIAAALKGAAAVRAIDHDPQALDATAENARRNGVEERIDIALPADAAREPADVVLANILAGPLVELASDIAGLVAEGGDLVLSGVLVEQAADVTAAYEAYLVPVSETRREDWVRLVLRRED